MKKLVSLPIIILMLGMSTPMMGAMSLNKVRQNARFLTDRMAYELRLNEMQYADVYEVNYDFIHDIRYIMDDVVRGYDYATDRYYTYLNYRNEDLRWILSASQYRRFMTMDYFYRPVYMTSHKWSFRIYDVYHNVNFFYFGVPHHYKTYNGGHSRSHYHVGYYKHHHKERYQHAPYKGHVDVRPHKPVMDKRKDYQDKRKVSVGNSNKASKPSVRKDNPKKKTQRSNEGGGKKGQREEGRKASRNR